MPLLEELNPKQLWDPVGKANKVTIQSPRKRKVADSEHKVFVILPDPQIGFRNINGYLDPFHDEAAMQVALQIIDYLYHQDRVDGVINLGDFSTW